MRISGLDALAKALNKKANMDDVKKVVKMNGSEMQSKMMRNATFTQGYQTGTTMRSIKLTVTNDNLTIRVAPTTEYASYPEYGTRFMDAQPYVRPAYHAQKEQFKKDLNRLMK